MNQEIPDVGKQWYQLLAYDHYNVLLKTSTRTKLIIPACITGIDENI